VAFNLVEQGYNNVYALKGGWDEWIEADYPTTAK